MAGLSDLDFSPGLVFQDIVKSRFGVPAPPPPHFFFGVLSFGGFPQLLDYSN
jgi:hypothetical protein